MYRRLLLIVVLGVLTTACAPYYGGQGYYRSDVYTVDRYEYRGYPYNRGYYVVPQPRYYAPAPRYYRPAPVPQYRPVPGHGYYNVRPAPGRYYQAPRYGQGQQWHQGRDNDHGRDHGRDRGRSDNGWGDRNSHR